MKRAWFQRIRGGGCQTLVYGGKTHVLLPCCFATFVFCHLVDFPSSLVNLFNAQLVVEAVIAFGGGCGRTVSPFPTCPLHPRLPILLPHALFLGLFNITPIFGLLAHPHAQVSLTDGLFILTQRLMVCSSSQWLVDSRA